MAAKNEEAGKKGLLIWQKPKIEHSKEFMLRLMQTSIPLVIVCMRAKYPMEGHGKDMKRSTVLEPKQSADILFEMMVHGYIDYYHNMHITKPRNRAEDKTGIVNSVFEDNKPITIETGKRLAKWASGAKSAPPTAPEIIEPFDYDAAGDKMCTATTDHELRSVFSEAWKRAKNDKEDGMADTIKAIYNEQKAKFGDAAK